ncbi:MAG: SMI1/KNR4 family protein [Bifidobacteriaceae bacterium]|jgi:hypothetical protein|nr:SMI1/KNR4 family protein [Bifidobacteriaceae bacterium]
MTRRHATGHFKDVDFDGFWDQSDYAREHEAQYYTEPAPSEELVAQIEAELGFRLPDAYVEFAGIRNGGMVARPPRRRRRLARWRGGGAGPGRADRARQGLLRVAR